jgi:fatty-acyl-CoA synthase
MNQNRGRAGTVGLRAPESRAGLDVRESLGEDASAHKGIDSLRQSYRGKHGVLPCARSSKGEESTLMTSTGIPFGRETIVWDRWRRHAEADPDKEAIVHYTAGEEPFRWTWGELLSATAHLAEKLRGIGVRQGDVCALIIRHNSLFHPTYMAVSALGALPSVLAYPNSRLHPDKFREGLEGMSKRSGLDFILTERELDPVVRPLATKPGSTLRQIVFPLEQYDDWKHADGRGWKHPPCSPDEPVLLQHSSGTTGLQKPVVLSHRAILEHVERYAASIGLTPEDRIISWLPLYHDMGLIAAYYLPLTFGCPTVQLDPFEWVSAPVILLEAISSERGTLCWLPNFAYNFTSDRVRAEDLDGVRLDSLRMLINCSEPVRAEAHMRLLGRFAAHGLRSTALAACYAMAETTYAVTQTPPGQQARVLPVDREALARGLVQEVVTSPAARLCVSSGRVIAGCQVRIVDEQRQDVSPGKVGEIAIASVSLFDGYRNYPEKTAEVLADGWYYSGDLGFLDGDECFVIGRKKDIIIVAGNNVYPEDVEDAVGKSPGVLPGRVVAFGTDDEELGTEVLCVIAETEAQSAEDKKRVRLSILQAGMGMDVTIGRAYLVPPRWLIKSSSGKPSRSANRTRALSEISWK